MITVMIFLMLCVLPAGVLAADSDVLQLPVCPEGETIRIPVENATYIVDANGKKTPISELPSFSTQQEANAYIQKILADLQTPYAAAPVFINFNTRAGHGDSIVAQENAGFATLSLHITYTTSGDNYTGRITACGAYTSFTGITAGFGWDERTCYAQILSSGKDIYGYAAGDLTYNILIDGFIEIGREPITLSGTAYAVR